MTKIFIRNTNTILYCKKWRETVEFYQHRLELPITFSSDWFVEFKLSGIAHLSVADDKKATIKSCKGAGITLTLQVDAIDETWQYLRNNGLSLEQVKEHPWGGRAFYLFDPEGHRIEIWSSE